MPLQSVSLLIPGYAINLLPPKPLDLCLKAPTVGPLLLCYLATLCGACCAALVPRVGGALLGPLGFRV